MRVANLISAVDSHTEGMGTRVVTAGVPPIPGRSVAEKKAYMQAHLDWLRTSLLFEPRGHADSFGAVLVPPGDPSADLGVIWMGPASYPDMCGHGSIGVTTVALETGLLPCVEGTAEVRLETPAGLVTARARVENGRVLSVSVRNVASFLVEAQQSLQVPGLGTLRVDVAYGGNFGVIVEAESAGVDLGQIAVADLLRIGARIRHAARERFQVVHPEHPQINDIIMVGFHAPPTRADADYRNVFMNDIHIDRSPCGTGSSARLAALFGRGQVGLGQPVVLESLLGTCYSLVLLEEARVGPYDAVVPEITGRAFVTGLQQFVIDQDDPFRHGFKLRIETLGLAQPPISVAGPAR